MASVTIRNIDDEVKQAARLAAAAKGVSLEAEIRALIERTYAPVAHKRAARIRAMSGKEFIAYLVETAGGVGLDLPKRTTDKGREIFGAD